MKASPRGLPFWAPRVLCLLFAAFISLFALDVFEGNRGFWQTTVAFLMHMIPTAVLLVILAIAWRWEWVGGIAFPALGLAYVVTVWGRFPWPTYVIIAGPLFVIGALFMVSRRRTLASPRAA